MKIQTAVVFALLSAGVLMSSSEADAQTIVGCAGTSITQTSKYPMLLQEKLGDDWVVYDGSTGGANATYGWNPYLETDAFPALCAQNPDIVLLEFGANDNKAGATWIDNNFYDRYLLFLDAFYDNIEPDPDIYIIIPPPIFPPALPENIEALAHIRTELWKVVNDHGYPVMDMYTPLVDHREYFMDDGAHPLGPSQGHAGDSMATVAYRVLMSGGPTAVEEPAHAAAKTPSSLTGNGRSVSVRVPGSDSWSLDLFTLDGAKVAEYSGSGPANVILGSRAVRSHMLLARLNTASGSVSEKLHLEK